MAEEQDLNATFFAFKKREQRFVLTRAAVGYFLIYLLLTAAYFALIWTSLGALIGWYGEAMQAASQGGEPSAPPVELFTLAPYAAAFAILALILFAAFEAACLRWLVRGESGGGVLGLTLGADTWRVFATYFLWLGFFIAFSILIVLFYVATQAISSLGGAATLMAIVLGALAPLGFLALLIWGAVRFAPAAATSIARGRFAFFEAPAVSRGRFWPLLGAFVILWVGYCVIVFIAGQIIQIPAQQAIQPVIRDMMTGSGGDIGARMMEAMSSPAYLISMGAYMVLSAIASTVLYIALFGVNARAVLAAEEAKTATAPT